MLKEWAVRYGHGKKSAGGGKQRERRPPTENQGSGCYKIGDGRERRQGFNWWTSELPSMEFVGNA
jgi:hypothetical protein